MNQYLFAYGTLMPAHAPAELGEIVRQFRRIGRGSVRGRLYDLGDYPGAVLVEGPDSIYGEVYRLPADQEILRKLDEYEGFDPSDPGGSLFARTKCPVRLENSEELSCWVYIYNRDPGSAKLVPGGDYLHLRATGD
jgi:gamma-glutamylcyclotransferase (GGCT)/AIG2-like uncharacterized protein YtfP